MNSALEDGNTITITQSQLWSLIRAAIKDEFDYSREGFNGEYMSDKATNELESDLDRWTELFIETKSQAGEIPL